MSKSLENLSLNHEFTPSQLVTINQQLESLLEGSEPDEARLLQIVSERDDFVTQHLESLTTADKKRFALAELETNQKLTIIAQTLYSASLKQLIGLKRGLKAVQQYK